MKTTKRVIGTIITLIIIIVAVSYLLPRRTHLEHATYIKGAPETVYNLLSDLGDFKNWSPWGGADKNIKYSLGQPQRGPNATLDWNSNNAAIGSGKLTIIDAQPDSRLRLLLTYANGKQAVLGFQLEPLEDGTHIVWTYDMDYGGSPFSRYWGLLHQRRIETAYEPSLNRLRHLAESRPTLPEKNIVTKTVDYEVNGQPFKGYLAYDKNRQNRPGVLIIPEWWGLTDTIRKRAEQLAELGYVAFAVDMADTPPPGVSAYRPSLDIYGDGKMEGHPDEATQLSKQVSEHFDTTVQRFNTALDILKNQPAVNPKHIAAIGYCFGGGIVLNMARAGVDLDGVVSFHGTLEPVDGKAKRGDIKASLLVLNGADDSLVPPEQQQAFREEMDAAGVDYEFVNYPGAKHAFTNPAADEYAKQFDLPVAYNANADKQSWQQMRNFFARIFH